MVSEKVISHCCRGGIHRQILAWGLPLLLLLLSGAGTAAAAFAPPPALLFTDLTSGPNTGGQDNLGAFITLYGEGFGATRGSSTVTIGGVEVARYVTWGQDNAPARQLDMIVVQPGSAALSGAIVVTVGGAPSNPLPFTVRNGQIYFVIPDAGNAGDGNPGTYLLPFKSLYRPRQVMQPGDISYIKGGTFNIADPDFPGWDTVLLLSPDPYANGTSSAPIAYIGYPGHRPVLGSPTLRRGIYMDGAIAYFVIANWEFTQHAGNMELTGVGHRIVGNYSHDGINGEGCVIGVAGNSSQLKIFGNFMRDNGETGDASGHALYIQGFGTNQDIDFGWNQVKDHRGRRAIQLFGHQNGDFMDNIRIHDNLLSGSMRNNILLGGSDGTTEVIGTIYIENNIIVGADWEGLRINDPQGTVTIRNNVLYNNGTLGVDGNHSQIFLERAGAGRITLQNNIVYAESGQTYYGFGAGVDSSAFHSVGNNLVFNAGTCPAWDTTCVHGNPLFASAASMDFRPSAGSPAIDAGIATGISRDYSGIARPQGSSYDIGAHEYFTGTAPVYHKVLLPLLLR